jgi:hypothetical protein
MGIFDRLKGNKKERRSLDITIDIDVVLSGPKSAKTKNNVYVPQTSRTIEVQIPNDIEIGQQVALRGCGLSGEDSKKGDLYL